MNPQIVAMTDQLTAAFREILEEHGFKVEVSIPTELGGNHLGINVKVCGTPDAKIIERLDDFFKEAAKRVGADLSEIESGDSD